MTGYIAGLPTLSQAALKALRSGKKLTPVQEILADAEIASLTAEIRKRRGEHENVHGPVEVEPPMLPIF